MGIGLIRKFGVFTAVLVSAHGISMIFGAPIKGNCSILMLLSLPFRINQRMRLIHPYSEASCL